LSQALEFGVETRFQELPTPKTHLSSKQFARREKDGIILQEMGLTVPPKNIVGPSRELCAVYLVDTAGVNPRRFQLILHSQDATSYNLPPSNHIPSPTLTEP